MLILEYIWLDSNNTPRSKTKVVKKKLHENIDIEKEKDVLSVSELWNFDGSSTGQATTEDSEIILRPVKCVKDPFRRQKGCFLVLCECLNVDMTPNKFNNRYYANEIFNKNINQKPMFGIEQEFFLSSYSNISDGVMELQPICFSNKDIPLKEQGDYYCGIGFDNAVGRHIIEDAFSNLIYANLNITGLNAEVAPSQWEFQVCSIGIDAADSLILTRYICNRSFEKFNCSLDLAVKPRENLNGSGCHVNFSTREMRAENGYNKIKEAIENLASKHLLHIKYYGSDNEKRLTGIHETSSIEEFSFGVGSRNTSIRIPNETFKNKCGYLEDRRPSSTMDPYVVTSLLYATSCNINQEKFV
jgi:glutamine synthetase